jgi:hypothetical protein
MDAGGRATPGAVAEGEVRRGSFYFLSKFPLIFY